MPAPVERRGARRIWSEVDFKALDLDIPPKEPPSFMQKGKELSGENVEFVVSGRFGLLVRDEEGRSYVVTPAEEPDWAFRPRTSELLSIVIIQDDFLSPGPPYDGLIFAGSMKSGKSTALESIVRAAVEFEMNVLFVRPKRARRIDRHQGLTDQFPEQVRLKEVVSIDDVTPIINKEIIGKDRKPLTVFDEMNILIFAPSSRFETIEAKAVAIAKIPEIVVAHEGKFVGALLDRFATGQAFPPIEEILALQRENPRIELVRMYAQCLCGANAEVSVLTETWWWEGEFFKGRKSTVRPLVPIDEKREAIESHYVPLCAGCHRRIYGSLADEKWASLNYYPAREFTIDLF